MKIKLYNTLTNKVEVFKPLSEEEVTFYSCGPTVYWYQHIGNMRMYLLNDFLKKVLEYNNYKVKHVINITDVGHLTSDADEGEDKMEKAAKKEGKTAKEISEFYFNTFLKDLKKLNIEMPYKWPRASEEIKKQIEIIEDLEKKGYTYKTSDGIYFDSSKLKDYGKLANLKKENIEAGKRIALGEKKHNTDFALWKFSPENSKRQQEWKSPWGVGFPGWHLECSAMSIKYLGKTIDIHSGGQEHIGVHHTNEIAQSECFTGKKFVNYWIHGAWLLDEKGEKISKSSGGLFTLSELEEKGFSPLDFRYLCLLTHYKKPLKFSLKKLESAKTALSRLKRKISEIKKLPSKGKSVKKYEAKFLDAINNDLNMPKAIQVFWTLIEDNSVSPKDKLKLIEKFDKVLSLDLTKEEKEDIPREIEDLVKERETLRKEKKWDESDKIRDQILKKGYELEDTKEGPSIKKSN